MDSVVVTQIQLLNANSMNRVLRKDVEKLTVGYRVLSGFFFTCAVVGGLGLAIALFSEPFETDILYFVLLVIVSLHVSGSITFTGYAQFYLLSAHQPKKRRES